MMRKTAGAALLDTIIFMLSAAMINPIPNSMGMQIIKDIISILIYRKNLNSVMTKILWFWGQPLTMKTGMLSTPDIR